MWKVQTLSSFFFVNIRESLEILGISRIFSRKYRAFFWIKIFLLDRRAGGLRRQQLLRAPRLPGEHHVRLLRRPGGRPPQVSQHPQDDDLETDDGDDGRKPPPPPGAGFFSQVRFLIEGDKSVQSYSKPESYDERRAAVIRGRLVVLSAAISNTW